MKIFLDFLDKRTKFLKTKLSSFEILEANEQNYQKAENGDFAIFAPSKKWTKEELLSLPNNVTLFCGKVENSLELILKEKNIRHINFLNDERFSLENAKLTAEGVLALVIENSPKSLFENNILILGGGRIAKSLAILFSKLGVKFSMTSFQQTSFFETQYFCSHCFFGFDFMKNIKEFDVIINTRPFEFFDEEKIKQIENNTLFIETASIPCLDETKAGHFLFLKAPALPTKFCFESAANLLLKKILGEMK